MAKAETGMLVFGGTTKPMVESDYEWTRQMEKARRQSIQKKPPTSSGPISAETGLSLDEELNAIGRMLTDVNGYTSQRVPPTTLAIDPNITTYRIVDADHAERCLILDSLPVMIRADLVVSGSAKVAAAIFLNIEMIQVRNLDVDGRTANELEVRQG